MSFKIKKPEPGTYPENYKQYIDLIPETDIITFLEEQQSETLIFFRELTEDQLSYRYADGKWSVKQILKHVIDTEQIFDYRALCFSRNETISLPGFDQDNYIAQSNADQLTQSALLNEFEILRSFTIRMFKNFDEDMWNRKGRANDLNFSIRAIPFIIAGHLGHHVKITSDKYVSNSK